MKNNIIKLKTTIINTYTPNYIINFTKKHNNINDHNKYSTNVFTRVGNGYS